MQSLSWEVSLRKTAEADVVSIMYDPRVCVNRHAAPNKYYEALMLGKPVIWSTGMEIGKEAEKEQCGVSVEYGNVEELQKAVEYLMQPGVLKSMGERARALFEYKYKDAAWKKIEDLYKKMALIA